MELINTKNFDWFNFRMWIAPERFRRLPEPLPWVEPSINMPFLQACASYVFDQCLGCILLTAALLEHALRIAAIDAKSGFQGAMDQKLWEKYSRYSIADFFEREPDVVGGLVEDASWWTDVAAAVVRNKTFHLDIPAILSKLGTKEEYMGIYTVRADRDYVYSNRFWWGAIFHRLDESVARVFLSQAAGHLRILIAKTGWKPDRSNWASQEAEYNSFFAYPWTLEAMAGSLEKYFKSRTLIETPRRDTGPKIKFLEED